MLIQFERYCEEQAATLSAEMRNATEERVRNAEEVSARRELEEAVAAVAVAKAKAAAAAAKAALDDGIGNGSHRDNENEQEEATEPTSEDELMKEKGEETITGKKRKINNNDDGDRKVEGGNNNTSGQSKTSKKNKGDAGGGHKNTGGKIRQYNKIVYYCFYIKYVVFLSLL